MAELQEIDTKNQLRKEIEQATVDVVSAQSEYEASIEQFQAVKESNEVSTEKFHLGLMNSVDYLFEKNQPDYFGKQIITIKIQLDFQLQNTRFLQRNLINLIKKHTIMKKKIIYIIVALVIVAGGFTMYKSFGKAKQTVELETAKVVRGGISDEITATGTLEALETVEVGTQVSGVIQKIYVDYNTQVKKGQLLAKLDETPLVAQLEQSKATVDQAEAEVQYQKATYDRYKVLIEKKLIAQSDYDLVVYNYNKAIASLKQAKSVYDKNEINLSYATIFSPIDGIILDRAVDEGQTVAASFNTPTLFTIANDLTQMQVEANVDEADIGKLVVGQRVDFTVDAYPNMKFDGKVTQIRLQPIASSNVITYTVVVDAPNPEKKLMPGMTANVSFYVTEKNNIVLPSGKSTEF